MRVCLITQRTLCPDEDHLLARVEQAVAAGVSLVQVREKDLDGGQLHDLTRRVLDAVGRAAPGTQVPVVVNGRLDVALAAGASGVHLPADGLRPGDVRQVAPRPFLVGVSAHRSDELVAAELDGADYAFFGPVFATASHPGRAGIGPVALGLATASTGLPIWAIGGVGPQNCAELAGLSLAGVAAIRSILTADDVGDAVRRLAASGRSSASRS